MRNAHRGVDLRLDGESVTSPGKKSISLGDHPVKATIEVNDRESGKRRLGRDQSGRGSGRGDCLVEERDSKGGTAERFEDGKRRNSALSIAVEANEGAFAGIKVLRCRDGCRKKRERAAEDLELGIWLGLASGETSLRMTRE